MKQCPRCGTTDLALFGRNRSEPDGYQRWCKACRRAHYRQDRAVNGDVRRQQEATHRHRRREELAAYHRAYRVAHPEQMRRYRALTRRKHREAIDAYNLCYRETHRVEHRLANQRWYRANGERYRHYRLKRLALMAAGVVADFDPQDIYQRDRWHCQICGQMVVATLRWPHPQSRSLDHIIPLSRGGSHTRDNVQLAHLFCNMQKFTRIVVKDSYDASV